MERPARDNLGIVGTGNGTLNRAANLTWISTACMVGFLMTEVLPDDGQFFRQQTVAVTVPVRIFIEVPSDLHCMPLCQESGQR